MTVDLSSSKVLLVSGLLLMFASLVASVESPTPFHKIIRSIDRANDNVHSANAPDCNHQSSRYDPLACWLFHLAIDLPDEHIKKGIFSVSVKDMACTNVTLESMDSTYTPSNQTSKNNPLVSLDLSGVSATCIGKYKSTGMSGTVRATVTQKEGSNHNMNLAMEFISSNWKNDTNIRLATAVKTRSCCMSALEVPSHGGIHFSGSISAKFIDLFSQPLAKYISSTLEKQLCPLLQTNVDPLLTSAIQKANAYMTSLIPGQAKLNERQVIAVADRDLVDFARDTPLLTWASDVLNQVLLDRYLNKGIVRDLFEKHGQGANKSDCPDCGYFFNGVNGVVKSLTGGTVHFDIPDFLHHLRNFTVVIANFGEVNIVIGEIKVEGLDKLSKLEALRYAGSQDLVSTVILNDGLKVAADVSITVKSIDGGMFQGDPLLEEFHVTINSTSVSLVGNVLANVNRTSFMEMTVLDVISSISSAWHEYNYSGLDCLIKPVESVALTNILAQVNLSSVELIPALNTSTVLSAAATGHSLEVDVDKLVNNVLSLYTAEYSLLVMDFATGLVNGPVRSKINRYVADWRRSLPTSNVSDPGHCSVQQEDNNTVPDYFDFRKWGILPNLNRFLRKPATLKTMNSYVNCVSNYVDHWLSPYQFSWFGLADGLAVKIRDLSFDHFGSLQEIGFLNPTNDGRGIYNSLRIGICDALTSSNGTCLNAPSVSLSTDFSYPRLNVSGCFNITVTVGDIALSGGTKLYYDLNKLGSLKVAQLLAREQCAAVPASVINMYGFSLDVGFADLNLSSIVESSAFEPIHFDFDCSENDKILQHLSPFLSWSLLSAQDIVNELSGTLLQTSTQLCEGNKVPNKTVRDEDSQKAFSHERLVLRWNLLFVGLASVVVQVCVALLLKWNDSTDQSTEDNELSEPLIPHHDTQDREIYELEIRNDEDSNSGDTQTLSLVSHPSVPYVVRHLLPIATIATMFLLLSSNLSTGASVEIQLSMPNAGTITLPSLFSFSLGNTVKEFYYAGIWALLFLVVVFSGMWPYVKLKLMLCAWCAPDSYLSERKRERLLLALDALGKFSLVDTYVLVLMVVAFRFHLEVGEEAVVDVFVTPGLGFFGFLLATCSSLVIGHIMLFFHRKATTGVLPSSERKESLSEHEYADKINGRLRRMSPPFRIAVVGTILVTILLVAVGATRECFNFEFGGVAGIALGDNRLRRYSMLSLGSAIRQSAQDPSSFGIIMIEVAYIFYALVMPLACLGLMLLLFCCPMTLKLQHSLLAVAEIANAWSAVEVFVISIVASLLEISTFADFMIGHKCDLINQVLVDHFDKELGGDDKCFSVHSSVSADAWILCAGVILNSFLVSVLLRLLHCAMTERLRRERGNSSDILEDEEEKGNDAGLVQLLFRSRVEWLFFSDNVDLAVDATGTDQEHQLVPSHRATSRIWEEWRKVCSWT